MQKVTMQEYLQQPDRYELRPGSTEGAPPCPYGNQFEWVGYDKETSTYVRFTKSVFKLLVRQT
ncbi:MAG: hypothetical protein AB8H12_03335 [Lewinella sp.]